MDHMERRQNEELMEARRLRRQEQKRKLLMRQRVLAAVLLVIFVLSLILILRGCRNRREHPELYAKKDTTLQLETEPDTTVTISAVGDIMITDELLADAKQPDGSYNFAESFAAVSGYTLSSDLTIGNLECNFCGAPYAGKPDYRAPESLATAYTRPQENGRRGDVRELAIRFADGRRLTVVSPELFGFTLRPYSSAALETAAHAAE